MKFSLFGFSQPAALDLDLDLRDLSILRWFADFKNSGHMVSREIDGKMFYLVSYTAVAQQLVILNMGRDAVYRRFKKFCDKKILEKRVIYDEAKLVFFAPGENYAKLEDFSFIDEYIKNMEENDDDDDDGPPSCDNSFFDDDEDLSDDSSKDGNRNNDTNSDNDKNSNNSPSNFNNDPVDLKNMKNVIAIFESLNITKYKVLLNDSFSPFKNYFSLYDIKNIIKTNIDYYLTNRFFIQNIDKYIMDGQILTLDKKIAKSYSKDYTVLMNIALDLIGGEDNE